MSHRLASWRLALRLARREAWRRKAQTALMLVLIGLPVMAVSAAAVVWQTIDVTSAESVDRRLGSAAASVLLDEQEVVQAFDPDDGVVWAGDGRGSRGPDGAGRQRGATLGDVRAVLGEDRPIVAWHRHSLRFETEQGRAEAVVQELDLTDPLTEGLMRPVSGQYPPGPGEVVVNAALAERGPGVGDDLVLAYDGPDGPTTASLRIVGVAEDARTRREPIAAMLSGELGDVPAEDAGLSPTLLVGGGPVTWDQVRELNRSGAVVTSRAVLTDPPPESALPPQLNTDGEGDQATVAAMALIVVMVLIEVVLLAGPAFAVRAKGQAHTLALVAVAGGTPKQARRIVLATGVVVGALGGVLGVLGGIGVGHLALPIVERFQWEYLGPFDVPWEMLAAVAAFGVVSALLAAVVPALIASRQNVVAVLAGRRGEGRPSARSPIVGLVLLGLGVACGYAGSRAGAVSPGLVGGSAIVSVFGMILLVPVVVAVVARLAGRLPLPLRFAARDAARHRSRTVPAAAAVAATVAGVVALGVALASQAAADRADYDPQLRLGQGVVRMSADPDLPGARKVVANRLPGAGLTPVTGVQDEDEDGWVELAFRADGEELGQEGWSDYGAPYLVGPRTLELLELSTADRRRAEQVLARGGVVLLGTAHGEPSSVDGVTVVARRYDEAGDRSATVKIGAPAVSVRVAGPHAPASAVFPQAVVDRLGLDSVTAGLVVDGPIPAAAEQDIQESLAALPAAPYFYVERGHQPDPEVRMLQLILAVLGGVLMLGGTLTATLLALSDARPDLATMAAVGARPRTRRSIAASYALVVGLVGATLGTPVGFIPGLAISRPLTRHWETGATQLDIPWLLFVVVVVGLPLLTAAVVALCARSRLPMVARIE